MTVFIKWGLIDKIQYFFWYEPCNESIYIEFISYESQERVLNWFDSVILFYCVINPNQMDNILD